MPNWCNNNITIQGPTETIKTLWEQTTQDADGETGLLNAICPMPQSLDIVAGSMGAGTPEQAELEAKEQANLDKHGFKNWYDWRVINWGTKWDISTEGLEFVDNGDGTAAITGWFDSAWSPPIEAYVKFDEQFDNCYITASFFEPGMDFAGFYESDCGVEICEDLHGEYQEGEAASELYKRLDEEFGLSEQFEEWEEMEA